MTLSKTMLSTGVITAVAVGSFAAVGAVSAQSGSENRDALIERIALDTGSDAATVEASFEAIRDERRAERSEAKSEHLDSLVADGTLTQTQRDALEAKFDELKVGKEALKDQDLSREEKRAAIEEAREELQTWATEQGIDLQDIKPEQSERSGRKGHRGSHDKSGQLQGDDTPDTINATNVEES